MKSLRGNWVLKAADRYVGIPLVACVALLRPLVLMFQRRRIAELSPTAVIGLLATGAIGDAILASGIIADLRRHRPQSRIVLFTSNTNHAIGSLLPGVDECHCLPIIALWSAAMRMRRVRCDVLIDIGPWQRLNALLASLSGARLTVGFSTSGQYRHYAYDHAIAHSTQRHQLDNLRALLWPLAVPTGCAPTIKRTVGAPLAVPDAEFLVFHAWPGGCKSHFKRWPIEYWLELAGLARQRLNLPIVLTGGPANGEASAELAEILRTTGADIIDLAGRCSLAQTTAVLRRAKVVVSVDTGVLHLSAAAGAPTIGLHGPTRSARWGGVGARVIGIDAPGADAGYLELGFDHPRDPPDCMSRIRPAEVMLAINHQIQCTTMTPAMPDRGLAPSRREAEVVVDTDDTLVVNDWTQHAYGGSPLATEAA